MKFGFDRLDVGGFRGHFLPERLALGGEPRGVFRGLRVEILLKAGLVAFLREFPAGEVEIGGDFVALPGERREFFRARFFQRLELRPDRLEIAGPRREFRLQRLALGGELRNVLRAFAAEALLKFDLLDFVREFLPRLLEIGEHFVALLGDGREFFPAALPQSVEFRLDRLQRRGLLGDLFFQSLALRGDLRGFLRLLRAEIFVLLDVPELRGEFRFGAFEFLRERLALGGDGFQFGLRLGEFQRGRIPRADDVVAIETRRIFRGRGAGRWQDGHQRRGRLFRSGLVEPVELLGILRVRLRGRPGFLRSGRFAKRGRRRGSQPFPAKHGARGRQDVSRGAAAAEFLRERVRRGGRDAGDSAAIVPRRLHEVHQLLPRKTNLHIVLRAHFVAEDARRAAVNFQEIQRGLAVGDQRGEIADVEDEFRRHVVRAGAQEILRDAVEKIAELQPHLRVARGRGFRGDGRQVDARRPHLRRRAGRGLGFLGRKKIGDAFGGLVALPFASESIQKSFHAVALKSGARFFASGRRYYRPRLSLSLNNVGLR